MAKKEYKEVLIFVTGTTPQIITETIYALINKNPPVYPDEISVVTTTHGREIIKENLFDSGRFREFCKEFKLSENMLNEDTILVVKDYKGNLLDDIRDSSDNECLGNFITDVIKKKTHDEKVRLHCSLAGGRKTMSFYMGSALQLFGRPWDKLYHVLVTPAFESHPDFYYKPKKDKVLTPLNSPLKKDITSSHHSLHKALPLHPPLTKGGDGGLQPLHTNDAEIFLAEMPFIRLRDKITLDERSFIELVREGQKEIDTALTQPFVRIHLSDGLVSIGNKNIEFKPFHIVFYTYLLKQKLERCPYPDKMYCLECSDCFVQINDLATPGITETMAKDYEIIYGRHSDHVSNFRMKWKDGMDLGKLRSDRSKINRDIIENLEDETLSTYYTIASLRKYGATRFGVKVEKGKIRIE